MATLRRWEVQWTGLPGLPGLSVFHSDAATDLSLVLNAFFTAVKPLFPSSLTWNMNGSGDEFDDATGTLTGAFSGYAGFTFTGTSSDSNYAAGVGWLAQWRTAGIVNGRRVRGSTFMCPTTNGSFDNQGTISSSSLTTARNAVNTLAATGDLVIWHRPHPGASDGSSASVISGSVPDRVTSLRSRRF